MVEINIGDFNLKDINLLCFMYCMYYLDMLLNFEHFNVILCYIGVFDAIKCANPSLYDTWIVWLAFEGHKILLYTILLLF